MPGLNGMELQQALADRGQELAIVFLTGHGDIPMSVQAMKLGAEDYLAKPIDLDELLVTVQQTAGLTRPVPLRCNANQQLPADVVAESPLMQAIIRDVSLIAPSDTRVLITGESGVGKEVVARLIHNRSARSKGAFLAINCGALPETLLDSELFGHKAGSFTSADRDHLGYFQQADGGTLFLDEAGEMTLEGQAGNAIDVKGKRGMKLASELPSN